MPVLFKMYVNNDRADCAHFIHSQINEAIRVGGGQNKTNVIAVP